MILSPTCFTPHILFEDHDILALDKPPGIVVNRAQSVRALTIQDWAKSYITYKKNDYTKDAVILFEERSGIAHRLDKDTSGILLIAKHPDALVSLLDQFKKRTIEKTYTALVYDRIVPHEAVIRAPVGRLPWDPHRFGVVPDGKEAQTSYAVLSYYQDTNKDQFSLLSLTPKTGRTHQIRVHLQYIKHPIVGDRLYSGRKRLKKSATWVKRMCLHASELIVRQPVTGKRIHITSALPDDIKTVLFHIEKIARA